MIKQLDNKHPGWVNEHSEPRGYETYAEAERTARNIKESYNGISIYKEIRVNIISLPNGTFYVHDTSRYECY